MTRTCYRLILRSEAGDKEVLRAESADHLRLCGPSVARSLPETAELLLLSPTGQVAEVFDIWTGTWRPSDPSSRKKDYSNV